MKFSLTFLSRSLWPRRLAVQITLIFLILIVGAIMVFGLNTAKKETDRTSRAMLEQARVLASNLSSTAADYLLVRDYTSIENLLLRIGRFPGIEEIQVSDEKGKRVGDLYRDASGTPVARFGQPALETPSDVRHLETVAGKKMMVWEPVELGHHIGWVRIVYDLHVLDVTKQRIWRDSLTLSLLLALTTIVLVIIVLRRPLRAIESYTEFADRLDSNQGEQIEVETGSRELVKLGTSLNHVSQRLNSQSDAIVKAINELERVAALSENNPDVVLSIDARHNVTYMNPAVFKMLKEDNRDEKDIYRYLPDNLREIHEQCIANEEIIKGVEHKTSGRSLLWTFAPVEEQGVLHCYALNVTKRKQAEKERMESDTRYRLLFDSANDGIFLLNNGTCVDCNPMAAQLFGVSRETIMGQPLHKFAPPNQSGGKNSREMYEQRLNEATEGTYQAFEWQCVNGKGDIFYTELSFSSFDFSGNLFVLCFIRDISERKQAEEQLLHQANFDPLTNLPNRLLALDRLAQAIKQGNRNKARVAVMFLDVDQFKKINDIMGHDSGDQLLIEIGERLLSCIREGDTVARLGGDEFLIIQCNINEVMESEAVAESILNVLSKPYHVGSRELFFSASIGITTYPDDTRSASTLLQYADAAMYKAKQEGRNTYRYYTPEINDRAKVRLDIETRLRQAIEREELSLHYQPQIDIQSESLIGAEALLRWRNPDLGFVSPDKFIPLAEDIGMMDKIGEWVLRRACRDAQAWHSQPDKPLRVAVNVSPVQFRGNNLLETVTSLIEGGEIAPDLLELELTESLLVEDAPETAQMLNKFKEMGIHLALDDFGTGYSSLSYLKKFPFDVLKIDRSFVNNVMTHPEDAALCKAIIAMATSLNLKVVGEGVETEEQLEFLRKHGAQYIQGYYYSKPLPATEFEYFMKTWHTVRGGRQIQRP